MRSWSRTARRGGIGGLTTLLQREDWNTAKGDVLRPTLHRYLDDIDPVNRWSAARVVHLVERDPEAALELIRRRLAVEEDFEVGGTLLALLGRFVSEHPELVDQLVYDAAFGPWRDAFDDEDSQVDYAFADGFVDLVLFLALTKGMPNARSLAQSWFEDPLESRVCDRAVTLARRYLTDGGPETRSGVFALLLLAMTAAEQARITADPESAEFREAFQVVSSVCSNVHLASGAFQNKHGQESLPPEGYLEHALPVFQKASAFREPSIVHDVVQTLAHLAPQDPKAALRCLRGIVDKDDPYSYDSLAQKATTDLCARYLAEFWKYIADDDALLTALREVLTFFVAAGHSSAIDLSLKLGEAFR